MEEQVPTAVPVVTSAIGCFMILLYLAIAAVTVWAFCRICSKAGYHWALGLLMLVPIANLVLILILGFGEWPIHKQTQATQQPAGPEPVQ